MTQNRSFAGAADAIETTKNGADRIGDELQSTFNSVTERAHTAYDQAMETMQQAAHDSYDFVGDAFRAGEDYVRRQPVQAIAAATVVGLVIGYCFAVRSAPLSVSRRALSSWR